MELKLYQKFQSLISQVSLSDAEDEEALFVVVMKFQSLISQVSLSDYISEKSL